MSPALEFRDVHRHFDREVVLDGLSFSVRPGEVFALLGRNGSGKTTAMRILLGFLGAHRGTAHVLGSDSAALSNETRARIGYVSEDHRLYPEMSVRDAIRFDAATRRGGFSERSNVFETGRNEDEAIFVADPADGSIWRVLVDDTAASLAVEATAIPGDDRVSRTAFVRTPTGQR